ncbi:MAG: tetratricopeptide (TPR) repeat protein [Pseudohongiellaceae bacterium]|jgi:tetratricopeptide (TPR) repeat protein
MKIMLLLSALTLLCMLSDTFAPQPLPLKLTEPALQSQATVSPQPKLLDLALSAADALPEQPHIKTRSQQQQAVVTTYLLLDQPERARRAAEHINNWRRGCALADVAGYKARNGSSLEQLQQSLSAIELLAQQATQEGSGQRWRSDRIRAKLAQVYVWLGQDKEIARHIAGIEDAELGRVTATQAEQLQESELGSELKRLTEVIKSGVFDQVRGAIGTGARLFDRFYESEQSRNMIRDTITPGAPFVSRQVWIELLHDLAGSASAHGDNTQSLEFLNEASALASDVEWLPEHRIAMLGRMAQQRHSAGDQEGAKSLTSEALALFAKKREAIVDIYRSESLLPVAEALHAMGQYSAATAVYRNALLEGTRNPNGAPQVEDIVALCCSMTLCDFEPEAAFLREISAAVSGLSAPW